MANFTSHSINISTISSVYDDLIKHITEADLNQITDSKFNIFSPGISIQNRTEIPRVGQHPVFVYNPLLSVVLLVLLSLVAIETVVTNMAVLLAFYIERPIRQAQNLWITSLAMSDVCLGIYGFAYGTQVLFGYWPYGWLLCRVWFVNDWAMYGMSQILACLIALDGYKSFTSFAYRKWRTKSKVVVFLAIVWILNYGVLILVLFFQSTGEEKMRGERPKCEISPTDIVVNALNIACFWISLFVLIFLSWRFHKMAADHKRHFEEQEKKRAACLDKTPSLLIKERVPSHTDMTYNCSEQELEEKAAEESNTPCAGPGGDRTAQAVEVPPGTPRARASRNFYRGKSQDRKCFTFRGTKPWCENYIFNAIYAHISRFDSRNHARERTSQYLDGNSYSKIKRRELNPTNFPNSLATTSKSTKLTLPGEGEEEMFGESYPNCRPANDLDANSNSTDDVINSSVDLSKLESTSYRVMPTSDDSSPTYFSQRRMRRAQMTVYFILWSFAIFYGPLAVLDFIEFTSKGNIPGYFYEICFQISYWNSGINPFIYAYRSNMYRATLKRIMKFNWRRNNRPFWR